jgi:N-acetylglucosamine kinase-like BadF-type ATPase
VSEAGLPAIFAVDGGNSKAEALLVAADGRLLSAVRSGTVSHQKVGWSGTVAGIEALAARAAEVAAMPAARPLAVLASYSLAGADFPAETRRLRLAIGGLGLTRRVVVRNDTRAALRAGSTRGWGVVLICGHGVNGTAVGPTGRTAGFDALGNYSGDWGGGGGLGEAALAAAVRARDGRGPATVLRRLVPEHFGLQSTGALVRALYHERIPWPELGDLAPLVFAAADGGDEVARGIIERLADELAAMALALIRRTGQTRLETDLVLAGGVLRADHPQLTEGLSARVRAVAPGVTPRILREPPVLGAALLGLEDLGLPAAELRSAEARLRSGIAATSFATLPAGEATSRS